jgi:hypothetical protein
MLIHSLQKNEDPPSASTMDHPSSPNGKAERNRRKKGAAKKKKADAKLKDMEETELLEELSKVSVGVKPEAEATKANPIETENGQISGEYILPSRNQHTR